MPKLLQSSNASAVSWLSFLALAGIVAVIGVTGSRFVILSQEKQLMLHGLDHDRRIASNMERFLRARLASDMPPAEVIREFQDVLMKLTDLETYSISLIDRKANRIVAHSRLSMVGSNPRELMRERERLTAEQGGAGVYLADTVDGKPVLVYHTRVPDVADPPRFEWTLTVAGDISDVVTGQETLSRRVSIIMMLTALLIVGLGFVALRQLGRRYERSLEQRLDDRTVELEAAQDEMLRKTTLASIGQTASMLAHEMRNPLAAVRLGLTDVLSGGSGLEERDRRRIALAVKEIERLNALLTDTLDYVRPASLSLDPVHFDEVVDKALAVQEPLLSRLHVRLKRNICPGCPAIRCDLAQIRQVLLNLLQNAIEACPEGREILVEVKRTTKGLEFSIENDSPPLAPRTLERAFDAFFTTKPRGTGLGLAVARRIIEEHHGAIAMEWMEPGRVRVHFVLPVQD
jgi:signal transduction histidine kinase